jgi:carbon monoxide dehydrogenase subunit G
MDIEKTLLVAAPPAQVWSLLLDPNVMGACVPGMQSIAVVSDLEYVSVIHVKIAFVSAKFKIKTTIVEQRAPHYLRSEGTGEDASVASSLKQSSEIFLTEVEGGQTELRMKIHVDLLGRLGTFGLSVMKTKADRMWEEFAQNLAARLVPASEGEPLTSATQQVAPSTPATEQGLPPVSPTTRAGAPVPVAQTRATSWWSRVFAPLLRQPATAGAPVWPHIRVDLRRGDTAITVYWPVEAAASCSDWLRSCDS